MSTDFRSSVYVTHNFVQNSLQRKNESLFQQFIESVNPIDKEEWENSRYLIRALIVVKAPIVFCLLLLIPIVDYDLENQGWSKLLNSIQIITLPFIILQITMDDISIIGISIAVATLVITVPLSVITFLTTRTDTLPNFHFLFAILATVGSILIMWIFATEIVNILDVLGIVTAKSRSFLGVTLLAWGNSIGDLFADIALAQQGYQNMAFSACFGGPLFYVILGFGVTFLYKSLKDENHLFAASQGAMGENCTVFLLLNLVITLIALIATDFSARRSIGIFMLSTYGLFFLYTALGEYEYIHPFGTDHLE